MHRGISIRRVTAADEFEVWFGGSPSMSTVGRPGRYTYCSARARRTFVEGGLSKDDLKRHIQETVRRPYRELLPDADHGEGANP